MARPKRRRSKAYLLLSTTGSQKEAKKIAEALVRGKLAACVNVVRNVQSFFRWQGKLEQAGEWLLIIKTDERSLKQVERMIRKHHSYEIPEIIGWPIRWGHGPYLKWLEESIS